MLSKIEINKLIAERDRLNKALKSPNLKQSTVNDYINRIREIHYKLKDVKLHE